MPSKKRTRSGTHAPCKEVAYTVVSRLPTQVEDSQNSSTKEEEESKCKVDWSLQDIPFTPKSKLHTTRSLDVEYYVDPPQQWQAMRSCKSFKSNGRKFYVNDFVYVTNKKSVKRKRTGDGAVPQQLLIDDWVARVLEIRARDKHFFVRILWMYWPEELPAGTIGSSKSTKGRQPYHGKHELIASNHMDVIHAVSVTRVAVVKQWAEADHENIQRWLYWRQALNFHTNQISSAKPICTCENPEHPDEMLVCCPRDECGKWMHVSCVRHEVLMKVYKRLKKRTSQNHTLIRVEDKTLRSAPILPRVKGRPYHGLIEATLHDAKDPTRWHIKDLRETITGGSEEWYEIASCLFCSNPLD